MQPIEQLFDFIKNSGLIVPYVFPYGSRVYGTFHENSDYDFVGVSLFEEHSGHFCVSDKIEITIYPIEEFTAMIGDHHITALECIWVDNLVQGKNNIFQVQVNLTKLRESISHKVSHCWVKGKKKLTVGSQPPKNDDKIIGIKSVFHAFRIVDYGIQLAHYGKIENYGSANKYWEWLSEFNGTWEELSKEFKSKLNTRMSEFRILCPKT